MLDIFLADNSHSKIQNEIFRFVRLFNSSRTNLFLIFVDVLWFENGSNFLSNLPEQLKVLVDYHRYQSRLEPMQ
jgi:hypothetical protein